MLHLNTYVMGLRLLEIFYSFSVGIDFRRQNLTSIDIIFWRLKSVPLKVLHFGKLCYFIYYLRNYFICEIILKFLDLRCRQWWSPRPGGLSVCSSDTGRLVKAASDRDTGIETPTRRSPTPLPPAPHVYTFPFRHLSTSHLSAPKPCQQRPSVGLMPCQCYGSWPIIDTVSSCNLSNLYILKKKRNIYWIPDVSLRIYCQDFFAVLAPRQSFDICVKTVIIGAFSDYVPSVRIDSAISVINKLIKKLAGSFSLSHLQNGKIGY